MTNSTKKAERAIVSIGDEIQINAYLLPNLIIKLAGRNVTDAIGMRAGSLSEIMGVKSLKALPHADLSLTSIKADTGESFVPVSIEDAVNYWVVMASKGNQKAIALIGALAIESLERRVDRAFGIKRSEEERDERLKLRMKRVANFFQWTDCIKTNQELQGIYRTDRGRDQFAKLVTKVNLALFNQPHFCCDRDNMTDEQQNTIAPFEMLLKKKYRPGCDLEQLIDDCLCFYLN